MQPPLLGISEKELAHGTGSADVAEAALFFDAVEIVERSLMRK